MRAEKESILNEVAERVKSSDFCFLLNHGGLKVTQLSALRQSLRKLGARAFVVKNSYLGRVAADLGWQGMSAMLAGPTAVVTGTGDASDVAKLLVEFVKKNDRAALKGATLEAATLSAADVDALAKLPSKDEMRGQLLGMLSAPATSLARVLNAPMLDLLYALKAYEEKQNGSAA